MTLKPKKQLFLIFDFGGGTFDVCLVDIEDGIMQVKDTDGDNWLGGKNLDNAIVEQILIPYLKKNFKNLEFGQSYENLMGMELDYMIVKGTK